MFYNQVEITNQFLGQFIIKYSFYCPPTLIWGPLKKTTSITIPIRRGSRLPSTKLQCVHYRFVKILECALQKVNLVTRVCSTPSWDKCWPRHGMTMECCLLSGRHRPQSHSKGLQTSTTIGQEHTTVTMLPILEDPYHRCIDMSIVSGEQRQQTRLHVSATNTAYPR